MIYSFGWVPLLLFHELVWSQAGLIGQAAAEV